MAGTCRVSEAEWEILEALWAQGASRPLEIVEAASAKNHWNHRTARTLLRRLVDKGVVGIKTEGGERLYHPLISREETRRQESRSFLDRVFGGRASSMILNLVESDALSEEELDELRKIIDRKG